MNILCFIWHFQWLPLTKENYWILILDFKDAAKNKQIDDLKRFSLIWKNISMPFGKFGIILIWIEKKLQE